MKVIYISSEVNPFASTGGLADVSAALPMALSMAGLSVTRIMPLYRQVWEGSFNLQDTGLHLDIPVGFRTHRADVWIHEDSEVPTYFIRRDEYFDRRELYSLPERDYDDNFERFTFFQKAAVALIDALDFGADIVHSNDWQGGLIPAFLREGTSSLGRTGGEKGEKSVFTIHNLAYQGIFPGTDFAYTNLPFACFSMEEGMEFYGNVNCMKGGIAMADLVTTVSPRYAEEIQTPEFGCGLDGVLSKVSSRLKGILNGVDYSLWDPRIDPNLVKRYSSKDLSGKKKCKKDLLKVMGLATDDLKRPVVGMVTRMVDQKGFDLLSKAMPELMNTGINFILLGSGQVEYHEIARKWAGTWPRRFAVKIGYDDELAHKIEAGADIFLMPSKFEPCGLNQLYSLRYGTLPVVHAVGGLVDTIADISVDGNQGNGFVFTEYTPAALIESVNRAIKLYGTSDWEKIQKRAMSSDYSWQNSASEYISAYESLL